MATSPTKNYILQKHQNNSASIRPQQPHQKIFNVIHTYSTMDKAHKNTEANEQLISIGKIITTKARIFANKVEKWNNKHTANQTWTNFKTHFNAAQINYKKEMPDGTFKYHVYQNQANVIEVFLHELDKRQVEIHAQAKAQHIIVE